MRNTEKRYAQKFKIRVFRMLPAAAAAAPVVKKHRAVIAALLSPPAHILRTKQRRKHARTPPAAWRAKLPGRST